MEPDQARAVGVILRADADGVYTLAEPDAGLEFRADHLRRDHRSGEIAGELQVTQNEHAARVDNCLSVATFNFSSAVARTQRAKLIRERGGKHLARVDVAEILEAFCQFIAKQERIGQPAVVLRDVSARKPEDNSFEVLGMKLPGRHLSILFGPGGTFKSYLALVVALTLALRGMRVLYVDWELYAEDHRYRVGCVGDGPIPDGLLYRRCFKPLVQEIDSLRRIGKSERIDYYILDSVGYGTAGDPAAADAAMDFCRATGQLGGGVLALAHITKNGENSDQTPYGSVFWHNSARSTYNIKLASESDDGATLGLFHRKANLGKRQPPIGLNVQFSGDRVRFTKTDIGEVDELAASLPKWQRIVSILRAGPQTLATIASELGESNASSLDRYVRRYPKLFTKVSGKDHITRIALMEGRAA